MRFLKYAMAMTLITLFGSGYLIAEDDAAKSYEKLKKEVEDVAKSTNKYGSSLKDVMQSLAKVSISQAKDQAKAIKSFQKGVEGLNKDLKKTTDQIQSLRDKRTQYFAAWESSIAAITNPDLKKSSEDRRQKVMADHAQLTEKATALRTRIDDFMKELNELSSVLGSDPTPGAVTSAKPTIDKVSTNGDALSKDVLNISGQLNSFAKGTN